MERNAFSLFFLSLSRSSPHHLRAPALHRRDAEDKVRGLALVRLLLLDKWNAGRKRDRDRDEILTSAFFVVNAPTCSFLSLVLRTRPRLCF